MSNNLSRRTFLQTATVTTAAAYASRVLPVWASVDRGTVATNTPLTTFAYSEVELFDSPMKRQFEENHARFLNLDDDRLLKVFRQVAGLPAPGEDMGGWYDLTGFSLEHNDFHGFIAGHSFGQYLSGLARAYAVTGSEPTRAKVNRLVKGYAETLDPKAKFFVNYRLPAYTYDKLSCGLIDAHEFAHDPMAMQVHEKLTHAITAYLPEKALSRQEQRSRPHRDTSYTWDETYTLPENLFLAYQRSGDPFYRDMAKKYLEDDTYFNPLSRGNNVLPFEHAYSHVNAFSSAMQAYITLGSEKHLRAAQNGFDMLLKTQSFATGGWGPNEGFGEPGTGQLGDSLGLTHASFETPCGAYGHFKITRYLLRITKNPQYGDSMERVLYNTILGAWPIQADGTSFYYSDYAATGKKVWYGQKWPCCSGTFPQLAADYHISTYLRSADGVYVNLFSPSRVQWNDGGARLGLTQNTKYPFDNKIQIEVSGSQSKDYTLYVRIPSWATPDPVLSVNGARVSDAAQPGTFAAIRRTWKDGDRVELELPMPLRLETIDANHPKLVALMQGPLVLLAIADSQPSFDRNALLEARPANNASGDWFADSADGSRVTMRPFMNIEKESYSTYVLLKS
ncbi:MAG TPA: beta-L-arabinofuranosidase domain-containing protein [Candidatus Acidoferrales bacterium]|nr:beta-L-arabinofuranosidase domain-containing protein [Candidatus Acidoferrales bacterium]